ncbi:Major Facilitator Superfamily [Aspergillus sclerotialis]|uniref:Major Facilitator Superfamily n=1 Tax=Aspergillus sclerotialis TaxID=2070753 RepID=A0A3A2ZIH2_9EURO|nr:Major Facilitator Superfamily [Aspergillus sclerotialis]
MPKIHEKIMEKENLRRVDVIGALLSLAWPTMLVFALEEGGEAYAWNSSQIIGTLTGSGVSLIAFGFYEVWVQRRGRQEPIFSVKFLKDPMLSLNLLAMLTMGSCFYAAIILLPQRFQAVNDISAAKAGITMLPFTILSPVFSMVCGMLLSKVPRSAGLVLICSSAVTIVGIALLGSFSTMSEPLSITPKVYGFEVILAVGLGFMMPPLIFFIKVEYDGDDLAAAMGANNTSRTLGGCVAVAVCSTILHSDLSSSLEDFLSPNKVEAVLSSTANTSGLSVSETTKMQQAYGQSYDTQFRALIAFAGVSFICSAIMWIIQYTRKVKYNNSSNCA